MEPKVKSGFTSSEFVTTLVQVAIATVMMFVSLGVIRPEDSEAISQNLTGIIGAIAALVANVASIWKYAQSRTTLKAEAMRATVQTKIAETAKPAAVSMDIATKTESK